MSNYNPSGGGLQYRGTRASAPPNCTFQPRDPTIYDRFGFSLLDHWLNTDTNTAWILVSLAGNETSNGSLATWVKINDGSITSGIFSVTGNDAVVVFGNASGNINIIGSGAISVTGNASSNTSTINVAIADTTTLGVVSLASSAETIAGTNATDATTSAGVQAKVGVQTLNGVAYGQGNTATIGWTAAGTTNTVLIGNTGSAPTFSSTPSVNSITINDMPVNPTDGVNKEYVDAISSGFTFINATFVATTGTNLTATYNNGTAGVGATLTNSGTQVALTIDGQLLTVSQRVLVKDQTTQFQNGIYSVTTVGTGSSNWVLTRTTDYDTVPPIAPGNLVPVTAGTLNAGTSWLQTETVATIGTNPLVFIPFTLNQDSFLLKANNLSDVDSAATSRINLGLTNVAVQSVTQYSTLVGGASNAITSVSPGTTGQVLTSNGPGANPSYQSASAGSGAYILLQTQTASNSNGLLFDLSGYSYNNYVFTLNKVLTTYNAGVSGVGPLFTIEGSQDAGMTFIAATTFGNENIYFNGSNYFTGVAGEISPSPNTNVTGRGINGNLTLFNINSAISASGTGDFSQVIASTGTPPFNIGIQNPFISVSWGSPTFNITINAIQFSFISAPAGGNNLIASGTISLYGIAQ